MATLSKRKPSQEDLGRMRGKKTKAARRGPLLDRASNAEEDPARTESQRLLANSKVLGKQLDSYMERFTTTVNERRSMLQGTVDRKAQAATKQSVTDHTQFLSIMAQGLTQARDFPTASTCLRNPNADPNPPRHSVCSAAHSPLNTLEHIIAKYDNLSHHEIFEETALRLGQGWEIDRAALHALFEAKRKLTATDIHNLLHDQAVQEEGVMTTEQTELWATYAVTGSERGEVPITLRDSTVGWTVTARQLKRSMRRVVRHLPLGEST